MLLRYSLLVPRWRAGAPLPSTRGVLLAINTQLVGCWNLANRKPHVMAGGGTARLRGINKSYKKLYVLVTVFQIVCFVLLEMRYFERS
ncbi:hypothetical protein Y032_0104g3597 [Ancylostoma ceylanicum]|uniref:Uncharacterized protein n=1 Tax=Ancylostoma ceylanicum TaxID=53326 RepID=A0A016TGP8_9BILA|nr:hypothetical protein Y032_0104g3597 [Ancylostoma ceylanicum]